MSTMRFLATRSLPEKEYARLIEFPVGRVLYWTQIIYAGEKYSDLFEGD